MITEEDWISVLAKARDECLDRLTKCLSDVGPDTFRTFFNNEILPKASFKHGEENPVEQIIAYFALIGAADAFLAWRERNQGKCK
jgi:hypothetical protein